MARSEARVFTSIWKDQDFLALEPGAQRLYMFLLSQEELTYCGTMPLRVPRWARKSAGLTIEDVEHDLKALEGTAYPSANPDPLSSHTPFVITDADTGELLVRALMRRDSAWKQPNLLKQARESAEQIESPRIRGALLAELRRLPLDETGSEQVKTLVADFIADLEQGSPYPPAYPPPNPGADPLDYPSGDPSAFDSPARGFLHSSYLHYSNYFYAAAGSEARHPPAGRLHADARHALLVGEELPHVNQDREFERFCDYWRAKPGKDGRKLDWVSTWRNWMRTAEDRQGPRDRNRDSRADMRGGARQQLATAEEARKLRPEDIV